MPVQRSNELRFRLMSMMDESFMEITFTGGRRMNFKFPVQAADETVVQRIEEFIKQPRVHHRQTRTEENSTHGHPCR